MNPLVEGVLMAGGVVILLVYAGIAMLLMMMRSVIPGLISVAMLFGLMAGVAIWNGLWAMPPFQKMLGFGVTLSVISVFIGSYLTNRRMVVKND